MYLCTCCSKYAQLHHRCKERTRNCVKKGQHQESQTHSEKSKKSNPSPPILFVAFVFWSYPLNGLYWIFCSWFRSFQAANSPLPPQGLTLSKEGIFSQISVLAWLGRSLHAKEIFARVGLEVCDHLATISAWTWLRLLGEQGLWLWPGMWLPAAPLCSAEWLSSNFPVHIKPSICTLYL